MFDVEGAVFEHFDCDVDDAGVDVDGDGFPDILLDHGSAIIIQDNMVTYDMKITATDTETAEVLHEQCFLASLDIGVPHPEFYEYPVGEIPQFGETLTLNIVDFSYDLNSTSLEWSSDDSTYYVL